MRRISTAFVDGRVQPPDKDTWYYQVRERCEKEITIILFCQGHFSFDWSHHLHWCRTCWRPPWGQQFHLPTDLCLPLLPRFTNNYPVFEIPCNNGTVISVANDDGFFWCLLWYSVHTQLTTFCFKLGSASMWTSRQMQEDPLHDSGTRHTLMFTYVSNSGVVSGTRYRTVISKHPIIPKKRAGRNQISLVQLLLLVLRTSNNTIVEFGNKFSEVTKCYWLHTDIMCFDLSTVGTLHGKWLGGLKNSSSHCSDWVGGGS